MVCLFSVLDLGRASGSSKKLDRSFLIPSIAVHKSRRVYNVGVLLPFGRSPHACTSGVLRGNMHAARTDD